MRLTFMKSAVCVAIFYVVLSFSPTSPFITQIKKLVDWNTRYFDLCRARNRVFMMLITCRSRTGICLSTSEIEKNLIWVKPGMWYYWTDANSTYYTVFKRTLYIYIYIYICLYVPLINSFLYYNSDTNLNEQVNNGEKCTYLRD